MTGEITEGTHNPLVLSFRNLVSTQSATTSDLHGTWKDASSQARRAISILKGPPTIGGSETAFKARTKPCDVCASVIFESRQGADALRWGLLESMYKKCRHYGT